MTLLYPGFPPDTENDSVATMSEQSRPIDRLLAIMARLRDPERGCPWDVAQSFATIAPYTIEEAYEVADAIARDDMAHLRDELGDLLLQVVYHAEMARESGLFDFDDVATTICEKMVRRHPYVFPPDGDGAIARRDADQNDAESQSLAWEDLKAAERRRHGAGGTSAPGVLAGIARALPALVRAAKLGRRASAVGFDWPSAAPVLDKIHEELGELKTEMAADAPRERLTDELGDVLFACANLARHLGVDPETALRGTNDKFEIRFRQMEDFLKVNNKALADIDAAEMERLWQRAKATEEPAGGDRRASSGENTT